MRKRIPFVVLLLSIVAMPVLQCHADTGYDIVSENIKAGEVVYYSFTLQENDGLYGRFRINYGEQIYFFIVDQNGHEAIQSGQQASTAFLTKCYAREEGQWHYWRFKVEHASTWYVYYSKAFGAPVTPEEVSIEGYVRQDTDSPTVTIRIPSGNQTGIVDIAVEAYDAGFPVTGLRIYIDNQAYKTYSITGNSRSIALTVSLDTGELHSGIYDIRIDVWDELGHVNSAFGILEVEHSEIPWLIVAMGIFGLLAVVFFVCTRDN